MEGVISLASQHPLVAILIAAVAVVVVFFFVKAYFWRILAVALLTVFGYYLYMNGYFTREKLERIKSVDVHSIEKKAEEGLSKGLDGAKDLSMKAVEKKADTVRDDMKKEVMPVLSNAPEKGSAAARAAAAQAAKKRTNPAVGESADKKRNSTTKTAP
jgi:hypothetical protein